MPRRTSAFTILVRCFFVPFLVALFPYGVLFVAVGATSLPFLAFVALIVTVIFNGLQWAGHRAFGAAFYGDDPAYQEFLRRGGDPYFHLTCPPPLNNDPDQVRWSGGDEPELQWVCRSCGTQICGPDAPCPNGCIYEQQWACGQCGSPVKDAWAACSICGNRPQQP